MPLRGSLSRSLITDSTSKFFCFPNTYGKEGKNISSNIYFSDLVLEQPVQSGEKIAFTAIMILLSAHNGHIRRIEEEELRKELTPDFGPSDWSNGHVGNLWIKTAF